MNDWGRFRLARPERLELPTLWFEARCSIQLSYGRATPLYPSSSLLETAPAEQGAFTSALVVADLQTRLFDLERTVGRPSAPNIYS
jgi:hypothetical protein